MRRPRDDDGFTLIEMVVAMSLFVIFLAIFGTAMFTVYRSSGRFQNTADSVQGTSVVFNELDHQIRYASYVSRPGQGGSGAWYVEWQNTGGATAVCGQLRLDPVAGTLAERTWTNPSTPTAWRVLTTGVVAPTQPFTLATASGAVKTAALTVSFTDANGQAQDRATSQTQVVLYALNTTAATPTAGICSGMRS